MAGAQLRDQLRRSAVLWVERGRPEDLLWTGASFLEYQIWREKYSGGLTDDEKAFAAAMIDKAGRKQRHKQIIVSTVVATLVVFLMVVGGFWRHSATQARRAEASELLARGQLELEENPTAALAYAVSSLELSDQPAGRRLVLEALAEGPPYTELMPGRIENLVYTPDGEWLVAGTAQGRVIAFANRTSEMRELADFGHSVELMCQPGVLMAYSSNGPAEFRWRLPDLKPMRRLDINNFSHTYNGLIYTTTYADPGSHLPEAAGLPKTLKVWPLQIGEPRILGQVAWDWWEISSGDHLESPSSVFLEEGGGVCHANRDCAPWTTAQGCHMAGWKQTMAGWEVPTI